MNNYEIETKTEVKLLAEMKDMIEQMNEHNGMFPDCEYLKGKIAANNLILGYINNRLENMNYGK